MNTAELERLRSTAESIRSSPSTPRFVASSPVPLAEARQAIERHIKDTYPKTLQAPMGYKPILICWMEVA